MLKDKINKRVLDAFTPLNLKGFFPPYYSRPLQFTAPPAPLIHLIVALGSTAHPKTHSTWLPWFAGGDINYRTVPRCRQPFIFLCEPPQQLKQRKQRELPLRRLLLGDSWRNFISASTILFIRFQRQFRLSTRTTI